MAALLTHYAWDWEQAERHFLRAIDLNPDNTNARRWYASHMAKLGRFDDAIAEANRLYQRDHLSLVMYGIRGWVFYLAGKYDEGVSVYRELLVMDRDFIPAHIHLILLYLAQGMPEAAVSDYEQMVAISGKDVPSLLSLGAYSYAAAGQPDRARQMLERLRQLSGRQYVSPWDMATVYVGLGEKDEAFRWLERAYEDRVWLMGLLAIEPALASLRPDPRFDDLARRVGLAP